MAEPERTCVGCREVRPRAQLIRFHLDTDDSLAVSRTGQGRGAWLCRDTVLSCFDVAVARNGFCRSLGRNIEAANHAVLRRLLEELNP